MRGKTGKKDKHTHTHTHTQKDYSINYIDDYLITQNMP